MKDIFRKRGKAMNILENAVLPMDYENYVFDLYGTLVDIHTEEDLALVWEKLSLFYGYYDAHYTPEELKQEYQNLIQGKEAEMKQEMLDTTVERYAHEAFPELEITEVFQKLFQKKGIEADHELSVHAGQFFRVLSTDYVRVYDGTRQMLSALKNAGKHVYLLSNAQRIFTEYEMHVLDIAKYFDTILISSDYGTKKPDRRFFDLLTEKCGLDVKQSLFIGNDSRTDIAGAEAIGMDSFYVCSNISPHNDAAPDAKYQVNHFQKWDY